MSEKQWAIFSLWVLLSTTSPAQHLTSYRDGATVGQNITEQLHLLDTRKALYGNGSAPEFQGTPYLTETFDSANIHTVKGVFRGVPMRYNIYEDYLEFKNKSVTYILDPTLNIIKVDFGSKSFVVEKIAETKLGFFELLDSGKVTLVAKMGVYYREPQPTRGIVEAIPAKYTRKGDEYMYKIEKGTLKEIGSIKKMIESFPDKQNELKEFVRMERISKNREDLIKLVRFYNSL